MLFSDVLAEPVVGVVALVVVLLCRLMKHVERRAVIKRARSTDLPAIAQAIEGPRLAIGQRSADEQGTAVPE